MWSQIAELVKYAFDAKNPILSIGIVLIIAFILFATAKRFFTTDYIAENKESRETLKQVEDSLRAEIERLTKKLDQMDCIAKENEELRIENKLLRDGIT